MSCIFCEILKGNLGCHKLYEDESVLAFKDVNPKAPVHFLVIPKEHINSVEAILPENMDIISRIFNVINKLAKDLNLSNGFRIVNNCGEDGGQTVPHMHFHILGGRSMAWPPG